MSPELTNLLRKFEVRVENEALLGEQEHGLLKRLKLAAEARATARADLVKAIESLEHQLAHAKTFPSDEPNRPSGYDHPTGGMPPV